jgi:hypothetical protein
MGALILPLILPRRFGTDKRAEQGQESLFLRAALQPKSLAGQEKGEELSAIRSSPSTNSAAIFAATRRDMGLSAAGVVARRS